VRVIIAMTVSDEAMHISSPQNGLLRFARNDGGTYPPCLSRASTFSPP
jgi:hypothetical protein